MAHHSISSTILISLVHIFVLFTVLVSASISSNNINYQAFINCLSNHSLDHNSQYPVYLPNTSSYNSILNNTIENLRFSSPQTRKPNLIATPVNESQVQALVICSKKYHFQIRTRSGGQDFEGLSYTSQQSLPFIVLNLVNFQGVDVDVANESAWVQGGATLGQLYYKIAEKSPTLGFPAGLCPPVGVGGHISGGGWGNMMRKYGLAADNVIDVRIVNANGEILDRKSMGEDLFWAINGGGAASYGIVLSWKLKLVHVPANVTVFAIPKTWQQGAVSLIHKWQFVAETLPDDLMVLIALSKSNGTTLALFQALYLGGKDQLLQIMNSSFPELGLKAQDCIETTWIRSTMFFFGLPLNGPLNILLDRNPRPKISSKTKSDFVKEPIPEIGLRGMWRRVSLADNPLILIAPYGGKMAEISGTSTPFPHRNGTLYHICYEVDWFIQGVDVSTKQLQLVRRLYRYMTPYVSNSPREAYLNYRDLDLGRNRIDGSATYEQAKFWGAKYFNENFDRLVKVKTKVDPDNFFSNEQSIPSIK
ncbi:hypothetical protein Scep_022863 [Stephania cephalantha]|uniref:FAD-binding PCMH-type domain-containing protein n=1 Tax=Stephania cephalantha TaxID=152367 RepID=A0AAP0I2Z1_9MAGN